MSAPRERTAAAPLKIWEGVYGTYEEAAARQEGPGFTGDTWRTRSSAGIRVCLAALAEGHPIPRLQLQRAALLPPVVAMMLARRDRIRVLDFGGNLGVGYLALVEGIPDAARRVDYTIVDVPAVCHEGRRLFPDAIAFRSTLPQEDTFDLVYSASALQYVPDWRVALHQLAACGSEFMLLSDLFAGPIPTFVTLQRYYDSLIPHWFWNVEEFLSACSEAGFEVVMKTFVSARRLEVEDILPMDHFPATHRLEQTLHLLLRRRER